MAAYGHVYCVLENKDGVIKNDLYGLREDEVENSIVREGLAGVYDRAMRRARLRIAVEENIIFLADPEEMIASFTLSEASFDRVYAHFKAGDNKLFDYDRMFQNCVRRARDALDIAGIKTGASFGYSAGRFYNKMRAISEGNLLASESGIIVIETIKDKAPIKGDPDHKKRDFIDLDFL